MLESSRRRGGVMARLEVLLLGGIQARRPSGSTIRLPGPKAQGLFAYLAARPGHARPRDTLAGLLWGDAPAARVRHRLRQVLLELRRALPRGVPPVLLETPDTVAVNPAAVVVDVAAFETAIRRGTPAALERAVALYRGQFLDGLRMREPAFDEWLITERERLRELARGALTRVLAHDLSAGALEPAIQAGLRLLAVDPVHEGAHRALMELYARQGRLGAARAQYQACVTALRQELGVEPDAETTWLYAELFEAPERAAGARAAGGEVDGEAADAPFVGRQSELPRLRDALAATMAGRGRLVVLSGEAGVGKTRLVTVLAREAWRAGATVLAGHAYESTRTLPFGPWVDALRPATQGDGARRGLGPAWQAELGRLFPDLAEPRRGTAAMPDNPTRLFEAVARLTRELASTQPLVLALEDLHWADEMSLRLLGFVTRQLGGWSVLCVATVREEDLADVPVLRQVLHELDRDAHVVTIAVPPLSRPETDALVRAMAPPRSPAAALARWTEQVWTASEGNPFTAVEIMRALGRGLALEGQDVSLPERVRDLIARSLERLSPLGREQVDAAAVIGRAFDPVLLQHACGHDARQAAEAVEELVRRRVFRAVGEGFDFTHDRIRGVAHGRLLEPRRRALHAAVGGALERLHAGRLEAVSDRLAFHYAQTDEADKAVAYLRALAEQAARAYAHHDAVTALEQALVHVDRLPAGPAHDATRLEVVLQRAYSLYFLGRLGEGVEALLAQTGTLARLDDASLAGRYWFWLAHLYTRLADHERAVRSAERAIEEAERCGDGATAGKAYGILGVEAYWAGDPRAGIELGRRGVALLEPTGERWWLGIGCFYLGINHFLRGDFADGLGMEQRVHDIGVGLGDRRLQSQAAGIIACIHAATGEGAAALDAARQAVGAAPDPVSRAVAEAILGYALLEQGGHDDAIPRLEPAVEQLGRFGLRQWHGWFLAVLAEAHRRARRLNQARQVGGEAVAVSRDSGSRFGLGWALRALGRAAGDEDRASEAEASLADALRAFEETDARFEAARSRLDLATSAHRRGNARDAAQHLHEAHAVFEALGVPRWLAATRSLAATMGVAPSAG